MTFADPAPRAYSIDRRWLLTIGTAVLAVALIAIMSEDKPDLPPDVPGGEGADNGERQPIVVCPSCGSKPSEPHAWQCMFGFV